MPSQCNSSRARRDRLAGLQGLAACALALAAAHAGATVTTVYKCFDGRLGVLYTDQPCRGEQLDIEGGKVDPLAVAELQREREALARSVAQRTADNRRATLQRDLAPAYVTPPPSPDYGNEIYYPAGFGYYPNYSTYADRRPGRDGIRPHPNAQHRERVSVVPAPRGNLIRR